MANTSSAKKRVRRDESKITVNTSRRSRIRTYIKRVETAIEAGDKDAANVALKEAQPELMRGVTRGVYKRNTAARKISRLSQRIKLI
ncbi:MAG: 30S ribosomal protein S20 [Alphaproteobacteria bacterium MarineAlpha11_Bin1]|nr:MAG: 30S ribosomal protein S20 [Alphaproteobacteria bacterium MarineAlpha11_Bin1]